ncbi:FAST kinase domain-containing protein 2, mitochondrial [Gouania willdenowi]|uniref:RAP domain-containing protein n=1 Tax=Gouania willdenowi TaxID=441366 RepID=A0A8C5HMI4_GOUWI|nr:FAST kinase domain-containing protein 2, mitochondrial [Gouania willdenowi]
MSVLLSKEVMGRVLLLCRRGFLWQRHGCLVTASATSVVTQQLAQFLSPKQSQTGLSWSLVRSVRFYTQERDELETPPPHASVQSEVTASRQGQRGSSFLDNLQCCVSPSDVLDVTRSYSLNTGQVNRCLTHIWAIAKRLSDEQRRYELQLLFEHPGFEELLKNASRTVWHMRLEDVTYSLLSMVNLGVPQDSRVIQTYLRACQERVNDFDEKSLSILASCLRHMDDSPNVVALKDGLRLVVETRLPGIKNVMVLQTLMRLLGKDTPKELKRKLERKALSMTDQFSLPNTQYMFSTLAVMGFCSKPLLDICSKKIKENLHGIPFNRLLQLLHSCFELQYRDAHMLTAVSDYIASTMDVWSNKQLLLFLSVFEDLVFCPDALMEAYAGKVMADPDTLTLKDLLCVLKVYSSFSYDLQQRRPEFLDSLTHVLSSYLPKMSTYALLKSVYCLCLLGHFPSAPFEQLLQSCTLEQLQESKFPQSKERMFQTIDLCLRLDSPTFPQPLSVPSSVLSLADFSQSSANPGLLQGLQKVLEEQEHAVLQEMVVVEKCYLIDAVITKRGESSQRFAVIFAPFFGFCYGTSKPRGSFAVKLRHLKILGYEPVPILEHELLSMSEEQRADFLRMRIFPQHQSSEKKHTF